MPEARIPEFITVHLGDPDDAAAPNIQVPFIDYIKNVASSEIYPTWPESALRANIYAQVTYALNRIYTEWYRSRGYDFDITSSTRYDQKFIQGREIFEPVSRIVDDLFNDYLVRQGFVQPLFAQYCNGTTSQCEGLSQWGTVDLAQEGLTPYEILQYYYGDDINIVFNAPTSANLPSYRGLPLRLGSAGEDVRTLKRQLNRIGQNYPGLRPRLELTGIFDVPMEEAVRSFQRIFNLNVDGIVGKATWYKIKSIFNGVRGLAELDAEGLTQEDVSREYATALRPGDSGEQVRQIQYYLSVLAYFDEELPLPGQSGVYDAATEATVRAFQRQQGLTEDGIVGRETWNAIIRDYARLRTSIPPEAGVSADEIYPGRVLTPGQTGRDVEVLQRFLVQAAQNVPEIPLIEETGVYDAQTEAAIRTVQGLEGITQTGVTGALTWDAVVSLAKDG
ncbi:MAG: peptidoglycan-binding protein [Oscillospiraceae bacterium]|nr:peptidoglycan-binding protein [Oscillospiraceae bacterium]